MAHTPKLPIPYGLFLEYDSSKAFSNPMRIKIPEGMRFLPDCKGGFKIHRSILQLVFRRTRASKVEQKLTGMELLYDMAGWTKVQEGPDPYMGWPQDWAQSHQAINHYLGT